MNHKRLNIEEEWSFFGKHWINIPWDAEVYQNLIGEHNGGRVGKETFVRSCGCDDAVVVAPKLR